MTPNTTAIQPSCPTLYEWAAGSRRTARTERATPWHSLPRRFFDSDRAAISSGASSAIAPKPGMCVSSNPSSRSNPTPGTPGTPGIPAVLARRFRRIDRAPVRAMSTKARPTGARRWSVAPGRATGGGMSRSRMHRCAPRDGSPRRGCLSVRGRFSLRRAGSSSRSLGFQRADRRVPVRARSVPIAPPSV